MTFVVFHLLFILNDILEWAQDLSASHIGIKRRYILDDLLNDIVVIWDTCLEHSLEIRTKANNVE
jgi:hypothetical protein